jgi:hypothetical protein
MDRIKPAIIKALKVGGYIATSIVLLGLGTYLSNPESVDELTKYLTGFGLPTAVVNMLISGIREYVRNAPKPTME